MKLWLFECKKVVWTPKFVWIAVLFIAAIGALLFRNILLEDYIEDKTKKEIDAFIQESDSLDSSYKLTLERLGGKDEETEKLQEMNNETRDILLDLKDVVATDNWQAWLTMENEFVTQIRDFRTEGGDHSLPGEDISYALALNNTLLSKEIPPEYENYSYSYPNFLKQAIDLFITFVSFILIALLLGELLTGEFEKQSINLLFTQPNKRTHIIWSKFSCALGVYIIMTGLLMLTATLVSKAFGHSGTFQYPVIIEKSGALTSIPIVDYIYQALIINAVVVIFIIALYLYYSLIFKQTLTALFALLATVAAGYGLTMIVTWRPLYWLNPFQYVLAEDAILLQNNAEWYQGIPVTLLIGVVLVLLSAQKIKTVKVN